MARLRWIAFAVAVAAGCTGGQSDAPTGTRVDGENGYSIVAPKGWTIERNPGSLWVYTGDKFIHENCGSTADRTHVSVGVDIFGPSAAQPPPSAFVERPATFTPSSGDGLVSGFSNQHCESSSQKIFFTDHDKRVSVTVVFGSESSKADRASAYRMLNSLRP